MREGPELIEAVSLGGFEKSAGSDEARTENGGGGVGVFLEKLVCVVGKPS